MSKTVINRLLVIAASFMWFVTGAFAQTVRLPGQAPAGKRYNDVQFARVGGWIREMAPACPPELSAAASQRFLDELAERRPERLEELAVSDASSSTFQSALLRHLTAVLSAPQHAELRAGLAKNRVETVLRDAGQLDAKTDSAALIAKMKSTSEVYFKRLVEGRVEDDELLTLLKRARGDTPVATVMQKTITARDIVSEFSRRNQSGAAAQRLQAYTIEGELRTASGEIQHLVLFRMRPDRFRLVVKSGESTQLIVASNGRGFWQQAPGRRPREISRTEMGGRVYFGEFLDPLFGGDEYEFEKLDDGVEGDIKFFRIAVRRPDGSRYVSRIDKENYREIARENGEGEMIKFSDFREIAGVMFAFRQEITDAAGRKGGLILQRIAANPGIVQGMFEPPGTTYPDYFSVEQLLVGGTADQSKP